jgi:quercetin dioxygenase-like cupin family protein
MADVGTKVIFEDDEIKVWNLIIDPGEASGLHTHDHNYFYYVVEGATLEICREDGTLNTVTMQTGDVVGGVEGSTHDAKNIDDKRFRNVLVEVKTS